MKTINRIFTLAAAVLLIFSTSVMAQEEPTRPGYVVVTKMYWNMDQENFDMDTWKSVEKEYLEKVTKKNEYVMGSSFYLHQFTEDNTELMYVQTYKDWESIDKAGDRNNELEKEAWPDENARKTFLKKQNSYYADKHSDEILRPISGAKVITEDPGKDVTLYLRKSHFSYPDDGTRKEFNELRTEFLENVIHKNEKIKGYYPSVHAWGADRTEFIEAFIVESLGDIDKMFDRNSELSKAHWPDKDARQEANKKRNKYLTGIHSDFIYTGVTGLSK
jgi:hypothetical protein